jgi:hypothetical protein
MLKTVIIPIDVSQVIRLFKAIALLIILMNCGIYLSIHQLPCHKSDPTGKNER